MKKITITKLSITICLVIAAVFIKKIKTTEMQSKIQLKSERPLRVSSVQKNNNKRDFQKYPKETQKKVAVLKEIFRSKNDNDSRIDTNFRELTALDKQALFEMYEELPRESRNERGTIVFLIGRNLNSEKDFDFLNSVLQEKRCLSLEDCDKVQNYENTEAAIHAAESSGLGVTLNYPQLVVLVSYERFLKNKPSIKFKEKIYNGVFQSSNYDSQLVNKKIAALKKKLLS